MQYHIYIYMRFVTISDTSPLVLSQNRIIFCDRMITNHDALSQQVSSSFLSISHQSHQSREFWRFHSYFNIVASRPIHNSKYFPRNSSSSEKKRCVTSRHVRHVTHSPTFCDSQFIQQQEDTQVTAYHHGWISRFLLTILSNFDKVVNCQKILTYQRRSFMKWFSMLFFKLIRFCVWNKTYYILW